MTGMDNKSRSFIDGVFSKVRWIEHERQEEEKIRKNERILRKKRIRTGLSILGASAVIVFFLILGMGVNMISVILCGTILLLGAALYENILS